MYFYIYRPPFTLIFSPVMYEESSDNKKATTDETSSGDAILPSGIFFVNDSIWSSDNAFVISVSMKPGETALTFIFLEDNSLARDFVNPNSPD